MRVLGVNVAAERAWLACLEDDVVVDIGVWMLSFPQAADENDRFSICVADASRLLSTQRIDRVRVLEAEPMYKAGYTAFRVRIETETAVLEAARLLGVDGRRLSRGTTRSLLGLPKSDPLASHAPDVLNAVGPHWKDKRDLAALAALAGGRD